MAKKTLLICDLDNTLYDWVRYFVPSFYAMIDTAVEIMRCDRETLLDDFRSVHQKYHDSEHPYSLLETETVKRRYQGQAPEAVALVLDPAFHAFNSARKRNLHLHVGVIETLDLLKNSGVVLIAHTESRFYAAADRLIRLKLFPYFSRVYCRERSISSRPGLWGGEHRRDWAPSEKIRELQEHESKPDPAILHEICAYEKLPIEVAAYVGDSLSKDVLMAKRCGMFSIWAAYGAEHDPSTYAALVRISHWTPDDVERERRFKEEAASVEPNFVARWSFREVLDALEIDVHPQHVARA